MSTGFAHDGGKQRPAAAVVSGYVLKLIREALPLSQEELAEVLGVERNTLQGWESGRRPLTSTQVQTALRLQARLRVLRADPVLLDFLPAAMEADQLLSDLLAEDGQKAALDEHPVSGWVLNRSTYDLLAWPIRGQPPPPLAAAAAQRRRGPAPAGPELTTTERTRFFERLRTLVERSL